MVDVCEMKKPMNTSSLETGGEAEEEEEENEEEKPDGVSRTKAWFLSLP